MSEAFVAPEVVLAPDRGRVVILAPHADDDVIGCGGTAALHAAQGDFVAVVVAFDGVLGVSVPGLDAAGKVELRRGEARAAGVELDVRHYEFLDHPEGHEPGPAEFTAAVAGLAERLTTLAPDIVYAPWPGEQHVDHRTLSRAASRALEAIDFTGSAWGYEVWTPLVPTRVVDVTRVYERKVAALRAHASQLAHTDLLHLSLGLAAHRSLFLGGPGRYGEAFAPLAVGEPGDAADSGGAGA